MLVIGMKSYGRNSAFLLKIGHQQVREGEVTVSACMHAHAHACACMHAAAPCIGAVVRSLTRSPLRLPPSSSLPALSCGIKVDDAMSLMTAQINELSGA